MKYFKIVIFFLLIYSPLQLSACENTTVPMDVIDVILPYTSIDFGRNLLQTCTHFNKKYNVHNNVTKDMIPTLSFGLDRILLENPRLCSHLPDSMHLKYLIHYATRYDRDHYKVTLQLFNSFRDHATADQKKLDLLLQAFINSDRSFGSLAPNKESTFVYQGKKNIDFLKVNEASPAPDFILPALITIYLTTTRHHQSLSALFLGAIEYDKIDLVKSLATNYPQLLNINDNVRVVYRKSLFLGKAVINKNVPLIQYLLPYYSIKTHYLRAMTEAPLDMLEILIDDCITKNILDPEIIADVLYARLPYIKLPTDYQALTDLFRKKSYENYHNVLEIILSTACLPQLWKWIFFDPYFDSNNSREKRLCELLYEKHSDRMIDLVIENKDLSEKININYIYPDKGLPILHMFVTERNYLSNWLNNRLDLNPNILSQDEYEETALHCVLRNNKFNEYTYWLLTHSKTDFYIADKNGKTVADLLARLLNIDILKEIPLHKVKKLSYLGLQCCMVQYYKSFLLSTAVFLFFMAKYLSGN